MEKPVSATIANREFSTLLRRVRGGLSYVVMLHGRAVARIAPAGKDTSAARGARAGLLKRLRSERVLKIGRSTRAALYKDKP
jgi:antitoxin (DNA-binding transcriptional repressor) of toxin-antitoxin stability system